MDKLLQQLLYCPAKLHQFTRGQRNCFFVDSEETEINNHARTALMLGNHSNGTGTEIGEMMHKVVRKAHPLPFV